MTENEKNGEILALREQIRVLNKEIKRLKHELQKREDYYEIAMKDNVRLRNHIAILMNWEPQPIEGGIKSNEDQA